MVVIQTPIGVLETSIPTIYGEKHEFRTSDGKKYDIPDWLGWVALIGGIVGGGALGGYIAWNTRGAIDAFTDVEKTAGKVGNFFAKLIK